MKILELKNISKNFGAVHALENVDLDITPGEALGLMGDNGAGKSTLVKIIAG
ncbi:ATP-binding cassette domain-containing protein, partial [Alphaproteobacteria bacterium]|nr:ATP-binding cassette domain-containing protein [Alphaproteobacteria bacterium]